jgi:hypothetical protein
VNFISLPPRQSHSKCGWQKWVKSVLMKLKILNLALNELKAFMKKRAIARIGKRLRGVAVRQKLTDEWAERGVQKPSNYAILYHFQESLDKP